MSSCTPRGQTGAAASDRDRPFPVIRDGPLLLPTPRIAARAADLLGEFGATRVIFGAAAPLGLLAPALRRAGARRIVGLTHGHETWWARLPAARQLLRRIGESCDHLTTISGYTERLIASALSPSARGRLLRLAPPVDTGRFRPPEAVALTQRRSLHCGRPADSPKGHGHAASRLADRDRSGRPESVLRGS